MIECDYFIVGMGIAGMGLKYKLKGNVVLVDKNPFGYKIGESHIPNLLHSDFSIFEKICPKLLKDLKSYQIKKGSVFSDSSEELYKVSTYTELKDLYSFHCERSELEKLLFKELNLDYKNEEVVDIDFASNTVYTDSNTYRVKKYILDCSGPRMFIADKLNVIEKIQKWDKTYAIRSYWDIEEIDTLKGKIDEYTLLNKIDENTWIWQIPLYGGKILSAGIVSTNKLSEEEEYINIIKKYKHPYYASIKKRKEDGSDIGKTYRRNNYAKIASHAASENYILVGDAYCFADPIFSVGSGVCMSEAIHIAEKLNSNSFNALEYNNKANELINTFLGNFTAWYNGEWKKEYILADIQKNSLQGGILDKTLGGFDSTLETYISLISSLEREYTGLNKGKRMITFLHEGLYKKESGGLKLGYHGINSENIELIENQKIIKILESLKFKIVAIDDIAKSCEKFLTGEELNLLSNHLSSIVKKRCIPIYFKRI